MKNGEDLDREDMLASLMEAREKEWKSWSKEDLIEALYDETYMSLCELETFGLQSLI